jgi:hypothetical protein
MRTISFAVLALLADGVTIGPAHFQQMRVKELRDYLAAHKTACIACKEKHEFVTKAMEVHKKIAKAKTKSKQPKQCPTSSLSSSSLPSSQEIHAFLLLTLAFTLALWKCCWAPARRMLYSWKKQRAPIDAITLKPVCDPYKLRCCGHVCERMTLAMWMQKSRLFRLNPLEIPQPVAQCHLCRSVFEPTSVRSLLWECDLDMPIPGDFAIESDICDPAFARGEVDRQHFCWIKTRRELEKERRNVAPSLQPINTANHPQIDYQGDDDYEQENEPL